MSIPRRRVTDAEMAARGRKAIRLLMHWRGLTEEELNRRMAAARPPGNLIQLVGSAVRREREKANMTRQELAYGSGLPLPLITALERGNLEDLTLAALINIAYALKVSPESIVRKSGIVT